MHIHHICEYKYIGAKFLAHLSSPNLFQISRGLYVYGGCLHVNNKSWQNIENISFFVEVYYEIFCITLLKLHNLKFILKIFLFYRYLSLLIS